MKKELNLFYTVKKGDTVNSIAQMYKVSPTSILIINSITPKMINEGYVLYIKTPN